MTRRVRIGRAFQNLTAGDYGALERVRMVVDNVRRRNWFGGGRRHACCGHYGDPGC